MTAPKYSTTPDGHYFLVKDRLWRCSNPHLSEELRQSLVKDLMAARSDVRHAADDDTMLAARARVDAAKVTLGERGPMWWSNGDPDVNRFHPKTQNTQTGGARYLMRIKLAIA